jgi:hypothetical protein
MRALVLGLVIAQATTAALAQPRPTTETLTCSQAQSFVASRGAVLMNSGPTTYDRFVASRGAVLMNSGPTTYDRFVASRAFCTGNDIAEPAYVRTRDNPQCALYACQSFRRAGGGG